jgi:hypothetical protein
MFSNSLVKKARRVTGNTAEGQQRFSESKQVEERLEELLPRIAEFVLRKWISEEDEKYLVTLLQRDLGSGNNSTLVYVQKKLEQIEVKARTTVKKSVNFLEPCNDHDDEKNRNMKNDSARISANRKDAEIVHKMDSSTYSKLNLDPDQVSNLFVEMCFFARLGFLQPPCCLLCSFKRSATSQNVMDQNTLKETQQCQRYVVWRQDSKILLSQKSLSGNLLLIRCCDAQTLILGGEVISMKQAWRWDFTKQQLVQRKTIGEDV